MLTFSFATAAGHFNEECLEYQRVALSSVRERIGSPSKATMESTLGTILLLAGVEVCLVTGQSLCHLLKIPDSPGPTKGATSGTTPHGRHLPAP